MLSNTLMRRIEWGDCDPAGIVFNPNFSSFFDHGTTMLYEAGGWPKHVMKKTFDIVGCPLVESRTKFMMPCRFGDDVEITSTVVEVRNSSFDIRHELKNKGKLCVESLDTRVWTVLDAETGRIKSAPIPSEIVSAFQGN